MVYIHTKNPNLGIFWRTLERNTYVGIFYDHLERFTAIWYSLYMTMWYSLWSFGIFFPFLYVLDQENLATLPDKLVDIQVCTKNVVFLW
jgi:hypothetical protein